MGGTADASATHARPRQRIPCHIVTPLVRPRRWDAPIHVVRDAVSLSPAPLLRNAIVPSKPALAQNETRPDGWLADGSCSGRPYLCPSDVVAICNSAAAFRHRLGPLEAVRVGSALSERSRSFQVTPALPATASSRSCVASRHVARRNDYNSRTNRITDRRSARNLTETWFECRRPVGLRRGEQGVRKCTSARRTPRFPAPGSSTLTALSRLSRARSLARTAT